MEPDDTEQRPDQPWDRLLPIVAEIERLILAGQEPAAIRAIRQMEDAALNLADTLTAERAWEMFYDLGEAFATIAPDAAARYFHSAVGRANDLSQLAETMNAIGNVQRQMGEPGKAVMVHREALEHAEAAGAEREELVIARNLGRDLRDAGLHEEALPHLAAVERRFEQLGLDSEAAETCLDLLCCARELGDWSLVEDLLGRAFALAESAASPDWVRAVLLHDEALLHLATAGQTERSLLAGAALAEAVALDFAGLDGGTAAHFRLGAAEMLVRVASDPLTPPPTADAYRSLVVETAGQARGWFSRQGFDDQAERCTAALRYGLPGGRRK